MIGGLAAIVLAAGRGTRFADGPKMLATLGGIPLVRHVTRAAVEAGLDPVLVVTGHEADAVEAALSGLRVRFAHNPDYRDGMATSLRTGFAALPADTPGAVVLLGDMPAVRAGLLRDLAAAWEEAARPAALLPVHDGRRGNPVILSRALAPAIASLEGDEGARRILRDRADVAEHPVDDPAVLLDLDTVEVLRRYESTTPWSTAT